MPATPAQAAGQYVTGGPYIARPCGYQQLSAAQTTAAIALTVPAQAKFAIFLVEAVSARFRDDNTAPTTSVGMLLPPGVPYTYTGNLNEVQFINSAAGTIVNVSYYF